MARRFKSCSSPIGKRLDMLFVSFVALQGFAALSFIDGVVVHLVQLRLHTRVESWFEHVYHTLRAVLFVPILALVYLGPGGSALWAGVAVVAIDQVVELLDMASENDSRRTLGGLSSGEYVVHVALTTLRSVALTSAFAARPASAWGSEFSPTLPLSTFMETSLWAILAGAALIAAAHLWLAVAHCPLKRCRA